MYESLSIQVQHSFDAGGKLSMFTLNTFAWSEEIESSKIVEPGAISGGFHDALIIGRGDHFVAALRSNGYNVLVRGGGGQGKVDQQFLAIREQARGAQAGGALQ